MSNKSAWDQNNAAPGGLPDPGGVGYLYEATAGVLTNVAEIPNSDLVNDGKITINTSGLITGGGAVAPGGTLNLTANLTPSPSKVTVFTANGTWTRDTTAVRYRFTGSASGGGGGGGGRYSSTSYGGFGGQGGGFFVFEIAATDLAATAYTITIGNGGAGGSAATVNETPGGDGGDGGDLTITNGANTLLKAEGGKGGLGGTNVAVTYTYDKGRGLFNGGAGAQQSISPPLTAPADAVDTQAAAGGGCGGGVGANNYAGSAGGITYVRPQTRSTAGAANAPSTPGGAGGAGNAPQLSLGCGGGGGGGGAAQHAAGGTGGAGINGSGGGGGGATTTGFNSGAGGAGGTGFLIVEEIY